MKPVYLEVRAGVRHWEDADVNGEPDTHGNRIPFRSGDNWCPLIRLEDGQIMDWPQGTTAHVHYKVCDSGEYWLLSEDRKAIGKWGGYYVPDSFLCHGDAGWGDYIIFKVGADGKVEGWQKPYIFWNKCEEHEKSQSGWNRS